MLYACTVLVLAAPLQNVFEARAALAMHEPPNIA